MHPKKFHLAVTGILLVFFLAASGTAVYFWNQYQKDEKVLNDPQGIAKEESRRLIEKVGKLIALPQEEPQLGTVANAAQLKTTQPFFEKAEDGDRLLMYQQSRQAILYRPSTNMVINVAPLVVGPQSSTPSAAASQSAVLPKATPKALPSILPVISP